MSFECVLHLIDPYLTGLDSHPISIVGTMGRYTCIYTIHDGPNSHLIIAGSRGCMTGSSREATLKGIVVLIDIRKIGNTAVRIKYVLF